MKRAPWSVLGTSVFLLLATGCGGPEGLFAPKPRLTALPGEKITSDKAAIKVWWQGDSPSPGRDAILVFCFHDTARMPTVVLAYNGIGGEYGCNYVGQFGGAGDGTFKAGWVYVRRDLIVRVKDECILRFQGGKCRIERIDVLDSSEPLKREAIARERAVRAAHIEAMQKEFKEDPFKGESDLGEVGEQFQKTGFIPYVRSWNDDVYPGSVPKPAERGTKPLRAYGTPGELEPIQAAAYALKDTTFAATISDLVGPGRLRAGKDVVITPIEALAVRSGGGSSVKGWQVKPAWLRLDEPQAVKAGTSKAWYITVHVPKNATAGDYRGTFTLRTAGGKAVFPVEFRVLPFVLDKAEHIARGAYIGGPVDDEFIQNMLDHSLNAASTWPSNYFAPKIVDGKCAAETMPTMDRYLRTLKQSGFVQMIYFGGGDPRYNNPAGVCKATGAEVGTPEFAKYYGEYWKDLRRQEKANGWPTLICCPFDEPVKSAEKTRNYETCYDIVKGVLPDMKVWCVFMNRGASAKTIGQKAEIWSINGGFAEVQAEKKAQAANGIEKLIYTYTVCMVNQRPGTARFNSGVNPWKYDADGMYFWAYLWHTNDPFDDLDGDVADWTPAARDVDGRIYNTVAFEGWREGLDDRLYIETCARMAREKNRSDILLRLDELKKNVAGGTESEFSTKTAGLDDFFFKVDNANQLDIYRARVVGMILEMLGTK
jgi:hypothetical protein